MVKSDGKDVIIPCLGGVCGCKVTHCTIASHCYEVAVANAQQATLRAQELPDEQKPGCFGAIGLPGKLTDPGCPCNWKARCRQAQEDC